MRTTAPLLALLAGCQLGLAEPHWSDQLIPGGVCREVNLVDGLDDQSTDELHALFACLNRTGNLEPLAELDAVMDTHSRTDVPIGITVVKLSNRLPASGFDVFGLAGKGLQALQQHDVEVETALHIVVEALYGRPYARVVETVDLRAQSELDLGLVRPALPLVSDLAQTLLDDGDAIPDLVLEVLDSDRVDDATCTLAALFDAEDPELQAVSDQMLPTLGEALDASVSADNDLWSGASGNSARDLMDALLFETGAADETTLEALTPSALVLLSDLELRDRIAVGLALAEARGQLDHLPTQVLHLISVNVDGQPLLPGQDSALYAGIRMLYRGDMDLVCTFLGFHINLGNLSETVIELMATEGIDSISDLVGFLGNVLDLPLTDLLLDAIADQGYCPPIDHEFLEDLRIIERFHDEEVQALLPMTMEFLTAIHPDRGISRVPELLTLLSIAYERGAVPPLEEAVRDLAPTQLAADAMTLLPFILEPASLVVDSCPSGSEPLDFDTLWAVAHDTLDTRDSGQTALQTLEPLLRTTVEHPATWVTLAHAASLAQEPTAEVQALPGLLVQGLSAIEDGSEARSDVAKLLGDEALREPVLALLESEPLLDSLGRADPDTEGPLPFIARLVTSEAVTVMLQTVDLVLDSLRGSDADRSD